MTDTRAALLNRKRDLYASVRVLEQDVADGVLDRHVYLAERSRLENEAAAILETLDHMAPDASDIRRRLPAMEPTLIRWLAAGAVAIVLAALAILLVTGPRGPSSAATRTSDQLATGSGSPTRIPRSVRQAEMAARSHPADAALQLELGNRWFAAGRLAQADAAYLRAAALAPGRPEAPALHAWMVGLSGKPAAGLEGLRQVEHAHPRYARAWLLQGLLLAQRKPGLHSAVAAWRHFLALEPHSSVSPEVRLLISNARAAERASR